MIIVRNEAETARVPTKSRTVCSYLASATILLLSCALAPAVAGNLNIVVSFNIQAESLDKALLQFGDQAHVQISFASTNVIAQRRTGKLVGSYTGQQVLVDLLRGSGLTFVEHGNTVEIVP